MAEKVDSQFHLGQLLRQAWEEQVLYNAELEELCPDRSNPARWTEILLLGMQSEIAELLREIGWKRHRGQTSLIREGKINRDNLAYEIADLTKYVLSLWGAWGFDETQMLQEVLKKNQIMRQRLEQEFRPFPPEGSKVLVVDLDQTLADLRYGFVDFGFRHNWIDLYRGYKIETLNADVDLNMDYRKFQEMKEKFIRSGSYEKLEEITASAASVRLAIEEGIYVIAVTDRPAHKYPRLWLETQKWLKKHSIKVDQLHMGGDERISILLELKERGYDVVLFDDDPDIIERTLNSEIKVVIQQYPYNAYLWRRNGVTLSSSPGVPIKFPFASSARGQASPVPPRDTEQRTPISGEESGV